VFIFLFLLANNNDNILGFLQCCCRQTNLTKNYAWFFTQWQLSSVAKITGLFGLTYFCLFQIYYLVTFFTFTVYCPNFTLLGHISVKLFACDIYRLILSIIFQYIYMSQKKEQTYLQYIISYNIFLCCRAFV